MKFSIYIRRILRIFWTETILTSNYLRDVIRRQSSRKGAGVESAIPSEEIRTTSTALHWTPGWRRKRGRPKETWHRTVEEELKAPQLGNHSETGPEQTELADLRCCPACRKAYQVWVNLISTQCFINKKVERWGGGSGENNNRTGSAGCQVQNRPSAYPGRS